MGIERFFNTLKNNYGDTIIRPLKTSYDTDFLFFDFNSIIHNISHSISESIIYLYHTYLCSNICSNIYKDNHDIIIFHLQNISTNNSFILTNKINLPDISTDDNEYKYEKKINFQKKEMSDFNIFDDTFFNIFNESNIDELVIQKVIEHVVDIINLIKNLQYVYIAIDGVPSYGKILEQKKRRYIGKLQQLYKQRLIELYKKELDVSSNNKDIFYNQYIFEHKIQQYMFDKAKISPGTKFMHQLELKLTDYFVNNIKIGYDIDCSDNYGEGEKKIVLKMNQMYNSSQHDKNIIVYSPDADVILMMLLKSNIYNILIMRYSPQDMIMETINIKLLRKIILDIIIDTKLTKNNNQNIIENVVMIFTLFGNDFLPKITEINIKLHIKIILNTLKIFNKQLIFINRKVDFNLLRELLISLQKKIKNKHSTQQVNHKNWRRDTNQLINKNAYEYYIHIYNIENIAGIYYDFVNENNNKKQNNKEQNNNYDMCYNYLHGLTWLMKYYLYDDIKINAYYYKYSTAPTLDDIIFFLTKSDEQLYNKLLIHDEYIINTNIYFTPSKHLQFITYDLNKKITIKIIKYNGHKIIDIKNNLNCVDANYLTKCLLNDAFKSAQDELNILNK